VETSGDRLTIYVKPDGRGLHPLPWAGNTLMSLNIRDISNDNTTGEILKALLRANTGKKKIIAEILNKLNTKTFLDIPYRSIDFTAESLCKCILFMELKGLNQQNLEIYLKTHKNERKKLGLKRTPDQTTFSHFLLKLDDESKNIIKLTVNKIEEIAGKKGIILDTIKIKKDRKNRRRKTEQYSLKERITKEVAKFFRKRIVPYIAFDLRFNCVYDEKILIAFFLYIAEHHMCAEDGAKNLRVVLKNSKILCPKCKHLLYPKEEISDDPCDYNLFLCVKCGHQKRIAPVGHTFRNQVKKSHSESEIIEMFTNVFKILWELTPESKASKKPEVYLAIDNTEWHFHGKKDNPYIVGGKLKDDTHYSFRFMTINIVQAGQRYTLMALPVTQTDNQRELVKELIEFARQRVKIKLLLLDKGFFNTECQKLINSFGIRYIIPCIKNPDVKTILKNPTPFVVNDCIMKGELHYNMAAITRKNRKGEDQIYAYATNIPLDENNMDKEAHWIDEEYDRRWGIEVSYRTKKHSYLPNTTSKDYRIRLFYFFFSVLLYNMWTLSNVLIFIEIYGEVGLKPIITANFFRTIFFYSDPGG